MKSMIEQMTTMIVMFVMVLVFTIIITVGVQILNARLIHSGAIEQLQSSYYSVTVDDLNRQVNDGWSFEIKELNSVKTRKDYEVILHYLIYLPIFRHTGINGTITGYAR